MSLTIGIIIILLIFTIIGNICSKKIKNIEDYYVAGRNANTPLIVGSLVASYLGTGTFMGDAGMAFDGYPLSLLIFMAMPAGGYVLGALLFGRFLHRSKCITVAEFFEKRYSSKKIRFAMGITIVIGMMAYLIVVTQGASIILSSLTHIPRSISLFIICFVYTSFTFSGGSKGVLITDTMMFTLFMISMIVITPFVITDAGGWNSAFDMIAHYGNGIFSSSGIIGTYDNFPEKNDPLIWAIIMGFMGILLVTGSPWQASRYLMAKNEHVVIRSSMIGGLSILLLYILIAATSLCGRILSPQPTTGEEVYINFALNILPTFIGIILLGGLMSAGISSASTFLSLLGGSITSDIIGIKNPKQELFVCRIAVVVCSLISMLTCFFNSPAILWLSFFAGSLFASSWTPIAIMSVWCKKITKKAVFWGIMVGFWGNLISKLIINTISITVPIWCDPFLIGLISNIAVTLIISHLDKITDENLSFRNSLFVKPTELYDTAQNSVTRRIAIFCAIGSLCISAFLFVVYYIPFTKL